MNKRDPTIPLPPPKLKNQDGHHRACANACAQFFSALTRSTCRLVDAPANKRAPFVLSTCREWLLTEAFFLFFQVEHSRAQFTMARTQKTKNNVQILEHQDAENKALIYVLNKFEIFCWYAEFPVVIGIFFSVHLSKHLTFKDVLFGIMISIWLNCRQTL